MLNVFTFLFAAIFLLSACSKTSRIVPETDSKPFRLERLLVLPFQDMSIIYGEHVSVRCPLSGNVLTTGKVEIGAAEILTKHLIDLVKHHKSIELIPSSQAQGVFSSLLSGTEKELSERELYIRTGRSLGADAVLIGYVYRFRERYGTEYSAGLPASVAFDIDLLHVDNGHILWSGHFDETQRSLTENIFQIGKFIKRKGRWITAKEMAIFGLEKVLQTFPTP
ncbi:hypothetical protein ACFL0M_00290 [Thermodesulfobacteriota bacterium]